MIGRIEGKVLPSHNDDAVIVDVGGVGFEVYVVAPEEYRPGQRVVLHTYLQVRENELTLYGFAEPEAKSLFEMLLGVSGVGPKVALSIMSTLSPETLRGAILNRQPEVLSRAPGVGRKTGESIILHLKDRMERLGAPATTITEDDTDVIAALTALGFSIVEAQAALQQLPRDEGLSVEEKIRRALALLGT